MSLRTGSVPALDGIMLSGRLLLLYQSGKEKRLKLWHFYLRGKRNSSSGLELLHGHWIIGNYLGLLNNLESDAGERG